MWSQISTFTKNISTFQRLSFAKRHIPEGTPKRWEIIIQFANDSQKEPETVTELQAKLLLEKLEYMDANAFPADEKLFMELCCMKGFHDKPLGIVLLSDNKQCKSCNGKLLVRADRPSHLTLYSNTLGTVPATHFSLYCQNWRKGCSFVQCYGFSKANDDTTDRTYDITWKSLPYFVSTQQTAFDMNLLIRLDADVLIGQNTYNQLSDIYNEIHGYCSKRKIGPCSSGEHCEDRLRPGSQYLASRPEVNVNAWANARIEPSSILAFAHAFTLTSGRDTRYCEPGLSLDRRRLEEGHFKYCILMVYSYYPDAFPSWNISSNILSTIDNITPVYYNYFTKRFAGRQQLTIFC